MLSMSEKLQAITHPLVSSLYMRKDFGSNHRGEDVLVIEASFPRPDDDYRTFDSYLMDLLVDLEDLKGKVENQIGKFDRVDIRTH
jgi:hypothetical protein